jgi:hypothetical protein
MFEMLGYMVLSLAIIAVIGVFVKVLLYALDTLSKNDD